MATEDQTISRDQMLVVMAETRIEVKNLKDTVAAGMNQLRDSVEEMVDRVTADVDEMRISFEKVPVMIEQINQHERRLTENESLTRSLDSWRWKLVGFSAAVGSIAAIVTKLLIH